MKGTIYRQVSVARHTSRPRPKQTASTLGSFGALLAKLGGASDQLKRSRARTRRA